jgi:hypothetical protein
MVKTKKAKVHKNLVKKLKRTRSIQETIDQGQKYLGNSQSILNLSTPPKPPKNHLKRTKTIEETIKTGNLYLTPKKPSNDNQASPKSKKN